MKKQLLAAAMALTASQASFAYLAEVELKQLSSNIEFDYDSGNDVELDSSETLLKGTLFFGQVDTSKGPLAEAAFLDKAGSVSLLYVNEDDEATYEYDKSKRKKDGDGFGIELHAVTGSLIIEAEYQAVAVDYDVSYSAEDEDTLIRFGLGGYMTDNSTIIVSLVNKKSEYESDFSKRTNYEDKGINTALKFFIPFNNGQALSVGGDVSLLDSNIRDTDGATVAIDLFANYYLTNKLGLKLGLDTDVFVGEDDDHGSDDTITVQTLSFSAEYFIVEQFAINGGLSLMTGTYEVDADFDSDIDADITGAEFSVGIKGRF